MKRMVSLLLTCAVILSLCALGCAASATKTFSDVPANADYAQALAWCVENGLMNGVDDGNRFDPDGSMTRSMLATVLYRQAGEPDVTGDPAFTDTQSNVWYSDAVVWANQKNLLRGYGNGLFGVDDSVSKEMLTVVMARQKGDDPAWTGDPALAVPAMRSEAVTALYETFYEPATEPTRRPSGGGSSRPSGGSSVTPTPTPTPTPTSDPEPAEGKVLVAYFSATGSTERVAGYIAGATDGDLFAMEPVAPYTSADLNYSNSSSRVSQEHNDPSLQDIALVKTTPDNWDDYDVVFIGDPIWWHAAAWPVNHFVTDNDFTGKTVIPFCTSASSPLEGSDEKLAAMTTTGDWKSGQRFQSSASQSTVESWVNGLELAAPQPDPTPTESKVLVAYFSRTGENYGVGVIEKGNTHIVADMIAEQLQAETFEIVPAIPYPEVYDECTAQAQKEKNENARPALADDLDSLEDYDVIFVGYPIWWSDMPMAVYTFLEGHDWSGKTVVPFSTHAGSGLAGTESSVERICAGATVLDGLAVRGITAQNDQAAAEKAVTDWLSGLAL